MTRKKAISIAVAASIAILFLLILLAVFFFPLVFVALLLLILLLGTLKKRKPEFFNALRKTPPSLPAVANRPTTPPTHENLKKTYMMLIGLNASHKHRITVDNSYFVIGRDAGCNYVIDDPMVSRRHLTIEYNDQDKLCYVKDNDSANGTSLNNRKLEPRKAIVLTHGDVLQIASIIFSVEYSHY